MAKLEELTPGVVVAGVVAGETVTVVASRWFGTAGLSLTYRHGDGRVAETLLYCDAEPTLLIDGTGSGWTFDGDGRLFRLAAEARRIQLAYLFDPRLAVHLSQIDPLPHQIQAVYGEMLPRQPLRFLLADDPGAGKTIMAGLYIKELMLRGDVARCLIVAPGGLVAQWQDELWEKFGLRFQILTKGEIEASQGNVFDEHRLLIARLDHLSRNEDLQDRLRGSEWDLIVVDEAHRMAAHYFGSEVKMTKRYLLGQVLGGVTRHLLLMTATPHAGKEEDFQLFMALLDADRFEGRFRDGVHVADTSDLMRRMVKEYLVRFDGTPLFPDRLATTVPYQLSPLEKQLYGDVTDYVRDELGRADRLKEDGQGRRGNRVGFAVTVLQRRVASSPEAIYQSLCRRRKRLEDRLAEERLRSRNGVLAPISQPESDVDTDDLEDWDAAEVEELEEELVDQASSARTLAELEAEIVTLRRLEELADRVRRSEEDRKWVELRGLLDAPEMRNPEGKRRKLIVFSEHRDTLNYLERKLVAYIGRPEAVVHIHGGTPREQRKVVQSKFMNDEDCLILVATDAAGEGLNLQRANLLVNYDLPWNPNRIEQRFGRVHRIGQTEPCHLWNLVAEDTREGEVYRKLLDKLEQMRLSLGKDGKGRDQVWDVLGEVLPERSLRDLLIEAIRYGDRPDVKAKMTRVIDETVGDGLRELIEEHALSSDVMSATDVQQIRAEMVEAEARRLQPAYVRAWFDEALLLFGGRMTERESGRYQISHVPFEVRQRDRQIGTGSPLLQRYERVTFEKDLVQFEGKPLAELVAPGHALMESLIDLTGERHRHLLSQGALLIDESSARVSPGVLVFVEHAVTDARDDGHGGRRTASRRFEFVEIDPAGNTASAGYAPYLDYRPATPEESTAVLAQVRSEKWLAGIEDRALEYAMATLAHEHLAETKGRVTVRVTKVRNAVHERLTREINYWDHRAAELRLQSEAGKTPKMNPDQAGRRADELQRRRTSRLAELDREEQLQASPPVIAGAALIVPLSMLVDLGLVPGGGSKRNEVVDTEGVERRAVDAVLAAERALGRRPVEMPHFNPGYDVRSLGPDSSVRFIEVKGRIESGTVFTVTQNELRHAGNIPADFVLAMVRVSETGPEYDEVRYLRDPFGADLRLPFNTTSTTLQWGPYWSRAETPS